MSKPWQLARDCGDSGLLAVYDAQGRKLALIFDEFAAPVMATAPELLATLEVLILASRGIKQTRTIETLVALDRAAEDGLAAIRKARGQA